MNLNEPYFSTKPDWDEQEDEEDTQKRPIIKPKKLIEESSVTISKEATDKNDEGAENIEDRPTSRMGTVSGELRLPDKLTEAPHKHLQGNFPALPATPRKNVIPSRRASLEAGPGPDEKTPRSPIVQRPVPRINQISDEDLRPSVPPNYDGRWDAIPDFPPDIQTPRQEETRADSGQMDLADAPTGVIPVQDAPIARSAEQAHTADRETLKMAVPAEAHSPLPLVPTTPGIATDLPPLAPESIQRAFHMTRGRAFLMAILLAIVIINATISGFSQFFGPQGWGSVFTSTSGQNLLQQISKNSKESTPGATIHATPTPITPETIVNELMANMTLDQKLGQLMMVQFYGQDYSSDLNTMITQQKVGGVIYYQANIGSKSQLIQLNAQMQKSSDLPMLISIDQEGGTVDRLVDIDGPEQSATTIGETGNANNAYQQGVIDAQDLSNYGFNLNLAPVVDVTNVYNSQLYMRTYGNNPTTVTQFAGAYLKGLQQSGKVLGTIKHFPGLGDTSTDPHFGLPYLTRSLSQLNAIDWAPYSNLIKQGNVYSIMVTHEIVKALDPNEPSSLSPQVIGVLRNQMHFNGVIITDSLNMDAIHNYYTYGDMAVKAIQAGDDILMGALDPSNVAEMLTGLKQALSAGTISQARIDESVRRILFFKYQMGLLHL
jgi:beta-N-acetylhexosaminidase